MSYFCNKCGYFGETSEHANCGYLAADINWKEKHLEAELSATKEKLEAAEKRIRESQEQRPYGYLDHQRGRMMPEFHYKHSSHEGMQAVYSMPPIPPELAELQRDNAELRKQLESLNDLHH